MMKPVTLKQIAMKFQVNEMTVSRALRGKGRMRMELRTQINEYANEMGYRRNPGPSLIKQGKHHSVALLCSQDLEKSFFTMHMLSGMITVLDEAGYSLNVIQMPTSLQKSKQDLFDFFRDWTVDGAIINYTHDLHENVKDAFKQFRIPKVWTNTRSPENSIYYNDFHASELLTQKMLVKMEGPLFYIGNTTSHHNSETDRREGYIHAMKEAGKPPILAKNYSRKGIGEMLKQHYKKGSFGAICYFPEFGTLCFKEAVRLGIKESEMYFGTFGHFQEEESEINTTLVVLSSTKLGEESAKLLLKRITKPTQTFPSVVIEPDFT